MEYQFISHNLPSFNGVILRTQVLRSESSYAINTSVWVSTKRSCDKKTSVSLCKYNFYFRLIFCIIPGHTCLRNVRNELFWYLIKLQQTEKKRFKVKLLFYKRGKWVGKTYICSIRHFEVASGSGFFLSYIILRILKTVGDVIISSSS